MPDPEKTLLTFLVPRDLLKRIDDFRFKHRFGNRTAAIKWLLNWALKQKPKPEAPKGDSGGPLSE